MDDFTDGLETTDNTPTLPEETPEPVIEPETTPETEQPSSSFASDLPDTAADQEQTQEQPEQTSEELEQETEVTPQEETGTISYEDLLKTLTEQTEEIRGKETGILYELSEHGYSLSGGLWLALWLYLYADSGELFKTLKGDDNGCNRRYYSSLFDRILCKTYGFNDSYRYGSGYDSTDIWAWYLRGCEDIQKCIRRKERL